MPAAVILVHGLRTSATMWRQQVDTLEARGIRTRAIDLPGHGRRMEERFDLDAALEAIGDAVAAETIATGERPYLVGFSLGGYMSIEWTARNPGRVCGLLAASCGTVPNRMIIDGWRLLAKGIHTLPDRGRALNDFALGIFVAPSGARDVLAGGVALEVMDDALQVIRALSPLASLAAIDEPVLFVNGRFDHVGLHAARFLAGTRRGRLVTVPGATHMVSVTHPAEFTQALLEGYTEATGAPVRPRLSDDAPDW
ncbi:MAG TPA: alpha/beta fold hydrolase [Marisediminicola sp.]|jgi:pimeloyl-ACP methyl ester carboxylesterase|nr:alpha/beta fold hydrolase [Marisediminicola sp.]